MEIHRWIFANVDAKMSSVKDHNAASRFKELLSGYSASPSLVDRIASRAGMKLEECRQWSRLQRHTFIAFFVYARFPVCLALNKVDQICDKVLEVTTQVKHAEARGELAVPCSARMECLRLEGVESAALKRTISAFGDTGTMALVSAAVSRSCLSSFTPLTTLNLRHP